jgi:hypothetical protein
MDLYDEHLPFHCATCGIGIASRPVIHLGLAFCCAGCAADGPCRCSYDPPGEPAVDEAAPVLAGAHG